MASDKKDCLGSSQFRTSHCEFFVYHLIALDDHKEIAKRER
jgi:hypothetical protein